MSRLLLRLQRSGLVENHGEGKPKGEPNAWTLTERGEAVHAAFGGTSELSGACAAWAGRCWAGRGSCSQVRVDMSSVLVYKHP